MAHLTSDRMLALQYDSAAMDAAETVHLAECNRCRAEWTALVQLGVEMAVARRSTPSVAARWRCNCSRHARLPSNSRMPLAARAAASATALGQVARP